MHPSSDPSFQGHKKREAKQTLDRREDLRIQFLFFPGCPNHKEAWRNLTEVLGKNEISATIERTVVETDRDAKKLGFLGSPTIKIDGLDVEPSARQRVDFAITCRVYRVNGQVLGAPPKDMISQAIMDHVL